MASSSSVATPLPLRDTSIDVAKGLAIIAIVLGHVARGLSAAGILPATAGVVTLDVWLYSWHLSVFALLSGLFVARSVQKTGPAQHVSKRLWQFAYLYLVWTLVQGGVKLAAPAGVNNPVSLSTVLQLWYPDGQLWFLPWIAMMTLLATLAATWRSSLRAALATGGAAVASLAAWGMPGQVIGLQGWGLAVFYFVGVWLGSERFQSLMRQLAAPRFSVLSVVALAAAAVATANVAVTTPNSYGALRTPASVAIGVVLSVVTTGAVLALSGTLAHLPLLGSLLAFCGRRSLEIFLAHIVAAAGTRTLLTMAGALDPLFHVVAGTLAGVVAPLILWRLGNQVRFPWLFMAPQPQRPSAAAAPIGRV